jgi:hypothetical protein
MLSPNDMLFISGFLIFVAFAVLNYGMLFAYFQREDITNSSNKKTAKKQILASLILCLPGPFSTVQIFVYTKRGDYGWKLYIGEPLMAERNHYWTNKYLRQAREEMLKENQREGNLIKCMAGIYVSLWRKWP